ncbi:DUF580-domain-containing protein, partial [Anaeromyces robustus]
KPQYQDVWASIVFALVVLGTIIVFGVSIPNIDLEKLANKTTNDTSNGTSGLDIVIMLLSSIISSGLVTFLYVVLMQKYAGKMIKGTLILSIVFNIIYALISFFVSPVMGGLMLIMAIIYALCFYFWRKRIPFAKVMLKTVTTVTRKYPACMLVGLIGCFVGAIWYGFVCITFGVAILALGSQDSDMGGVTYVVYIFIIFSFFFTSQVINNTVHVTISGVFATFYFRGVIEPGTKNINVDVKNPTVKSFKRAITTSFGSICFGSLIIAIIETLKTLAKNAKEQGREDGNAAVALIACCIECILSCVGDMIEYFNVYAFTEVAIYGKSYCEAAKDTWEICKSHGIEALINDNLIGNVLTLGSISVGCLSTVITVVVGFLILRIDNVAALVIYGILTFLIGLFLFSIVAQVINSGVATTFVCLCEDPDALRYTKPELWEKVKDTYPSV